MKMKKILAIAILVLAVFSCLSVVSAGFFDFLGGDQSSEEVNQTYDFKQFTLDLPANISIVNKTTQENGYGLDTYVITYKNGDVVIIETMTDTGIAFDDYTMGLASLGAKNMDKYGNWTVMDMQTLKASADDNTTYCNYGLIKQDGNNIINLEGNNLTALKALADTLKVKK